MRAHYLLVCLVELINRFYWSIVCLVELNNRFYRRIVCLVELINHFYWSDVKYNSARTVTTFSTNQYYIRTYV
jgi:hypothetical protein